MTDPAQTPVEPVNRVVVTGVLVDEGNGVIRAVRQRVDKPEQSRDEQAN